MASDLLESYMQQFSHNTAEIVSTTTKIPTLYGSKTVTTLTCRLYVFSVMWLVPSGTTILCGPTISLSPSLQDN